MIKASILVTLTRETLVQEGWNVWVRERDVLDLEFLGAWDARMLMLMGIVLVGWGVIDRSASAGCGSVMCTTGD
jgi:hypothetical protein